MLEDTWDFPRRPDISDGYLAGGSGFFPMWESYPIFQSKPKKQDTIGLADAITKSILSTGMSFINFWYLMLNFKVASS